jgi:alpha-L-arabinofuranosidase
LTALSEAAFMTGLERNADVVVMASYAPLFAHAEGWQWTPDLIWVDNLNVIGSANYQVQKLYSINKGTHIIPMLLNNEVIAGQDSLYASASLDKKTNELILKVVNASGKMQQSDIALEGVKKLAGKATLYQLSSEELDKVNTLGNPPAVAPVEKQLAVKGKKLKLSLAPYSFSVVRVKM